MGFISNPQIGDLDMMKNGDCHNTNTNLHQVYNLCQFFKSTYICYQANPILE